MKIKTISSTSRLNFDENVNEFLKTVNQDENELKFNFQANGNGIEFYSVMITITEKPKNPLNLKK